MGLPSLSQPQYVMRAAGFAEPNEELGFTQRFESEYSRLWSGYPRRRASNKNSPSLTNEVENIRRTRVDP
jgi:hypothetical protein